MAGTFALLDLPSQALAIERRLRGQPDDQKLAWLSSHGKVEHLSPMPGWPQVYLFESAIGLKCCFFLANDRIVFIGDNTTYTAKEDPPPNPTPQRNRPARTLFGIIKSILGGPDR